MKDIYIQIETQKRLCQAMAEEAYYRRALTMSSFNDKHYQGMLNRFKCSKLDVRRFSEA